MITVSNCVSEFMNDDQWVTLIDEPRALLLPSDFGDLDTCLAAAFRQAWSALPPCAVTAIGRHWQPTPQYLPGHIIIKALGNQGDDPILGETQRQGHRIEFDPRAVRLLPERLLVGLIHHELAHVYANATGNEHHPHVYETAAQLEQAEEAVRGILQEWGLPDTEEETAAWVLENRTGW